MTVKHKRISYTQNPYKQVDVETKEIEKGTNNSEIIRENIQLT